MEFGSAVILAGGKSSRMGFDKQFLKAETHPVLRLNGERLGEIFSQIIVVTQTPDLYRDTSFTVVSDEIPGGGPLSGIHVGLKTAASRYVYLLACDMPYVNLEYIEFMQRQIKDSSVAACVTRFGDWIEPFNAFYARSLVPDIEGYLSDGRKSVFHFLQQLKVLYIEEKEALRFSPGWEMFLNLNTRDEFEAWRRKLLTADPESPCVG